jgi:hypothetical protein
MVGIMQAPGDPKKNTLPTVTVTGVRKKTVEKPAAKEVVKGKKTFGVIWRSGDTTMMDEESMKKVMYSKQQ